MKVSCGGNLSDRTPCLQSNHNKWGSMDVLVYILIIAQIITILGLLGFIVWNTREHRQQVEELTNKLVARSLSEYVASRQGKVTIPEKKEKTAVLIDSTLGKEGNW